MLDKPYTNTLMYALNNSEGIKYIMPIFKDIYFPY